MRLIQSATVAIVGLALAAAGSSGYSLLGPGEAVAVTPTMADFTVSGGSWSVTHGALTLSRPVMGSANSANSAVRTMPASADFSLTVRGHATASSSVYDDFSVLFGYIDSRNHYLASFNESNDTGTHGLFRVRDGVSRELVNFPGRAAAGTPHTVKVVKTGSTVRVFLNGAAMGTTTAAFGSARVGVGTRNNGAAFSSISTTAASTPAPTAPATSAPPATTAPARSTYDATVLADNPAGFWHNAAGTDLVGGRNAARVGSPGTATLPNGDTAPAFDGSSKYLQIADNDRWSPATTGVLTIEAWIRPDTLQFTSGENGDCYVHWMGKGTSGQHEWVNRIYSRTGSCESPMRPNRVSGYAFNLQGGLGTGAYWQGDLNNVPAMQAGQWVHVMTVINSRAKGGSYPNGYVKIYRNGTLINTRDLSSTVPVKLGNGTAPVRIGTRDLNSYFQGAIGKVALYGHELSATRAMAHYNAMR